MLTRNNNAINLLDVSSTHDGKQTVKVGSLFVKLAGF